MCVLLFSGGADRPAKLRAFSDQPFHAFPEYGITVMLCWAKNCREEQDASTQIIFSAAGWRYYMLLLLGVWIKSQFEECPNNDSNFFFDAVNTNCPISINPFFSGYCIGTVLTQKRIYWLPAVHFARSKACNTLQNVFWTHSDSFSVSQDNAVPV